MTMQHPLPALFLAHGSPMLALEGGDWGLALSAFGRALPPLRAILVSSAHWETAAGFRITSALRPGVLHDFRGFPEALSALDYPAPGDPVLAEEVAAALARAGLPATLDDQRPLDHGVWAPLRYLAPQAEVPVLQVSLPRERTPAMLLAAGGALAAFRHQGVLIVGSGGIVHNLGRLDWHDQTVPQAWATDFEAWVEGRLAAGDPQGLARWREAPGAAASVPTTEHLDPLFLAVGAAAGPPLPIFKGWQLGSLSLTSLQFPG